jgi:hypothetical protein
VDHNFSLLSPTVSLNCHPSKLISIRPHSSQVISRPSISPEPSELVVRGPPGEKPNPNLP